MKKKLNLNLLILFLATLSIRATWAEDFTETGHFGVEGLVTADGVHGGPIYVHNFFEMSVDFDGSYNTSAPKRGDMGIETRLGYRINAHSYNYFSFGIDWHNSLFGQDDGVSTRGQYYIGPYFGFQRYFPNSPVMLTFYIMPFTFNHQIANDGAGNKQITNTAQFLQQGGFGITYLF